VPDAVATAPGGHLLALLGATGSSIVDSDDDAATTTSPISSLRAIATAGGRLCNLTALTADAFGPAGQPMVGGRCQSSEQVGIFELVANRWKLIGPSAPRSAVTEGASPHMPHPAITGSPASRSVVTEVLRLATEGSSVVALAEAVATDGTASLFQLRRSSLGAWTSSAAFDAPSSEQLMATGNEPNGSSFVLLSRDGSLTAIVLPSAGSHWSKLPSPPAGTATLVLGAGGVTEALAVHGSLLTVFALERSRRWSQVQVINVPIDVGASP
jgi:hypothetical protein